MKLNNIDLDQFNIYDKLYKPKFKLGEIVYFITDDDYNEYLIFAYIIDINGNIQYKITRNGSYNTVDDFEITTKIK